MKLIYLAAIRIPTEKAHGLTITKSCEAIARIGADVELWVPSRRNKLQADLFSHYQIQPVFKVLYIPSFEFPDRLRNQITFKLQTALFYLHVAARLLFGDRNAIIYTRDTMGILMSLLGYRVTYECHETPGKPGSAYVAWCRLADKVVVTTTTLEEFFIKNGLSKEKILRAPNGVDLSIFSNSLTKEAARTQLNLPSEARIIMYTGNFTTFGEDKGIEVILASLSDLKNVLFVAVGGSDMDRKRYSALAESMGVQEQTRLIGYVPQASLAAYEAAADILLMPFPDKPHYRKHMSPVKMFEYLAAERPIIATDLPTITEVLTPYVAYIIPADSPSALAQAVDEIFANPGEAQTRARAARALSLGYSWEARATRILAFIGVVN